MVATSITINVATSIINVYVNMHDDKLLIESTMVWLERRHLAFAVANCVFNLRFAAALFDAAETAGSCGRLLARPAIGRKMLFLFQLLFFPYNSNKLRSQRESCLFSTLVWGERVEVPMWCVRLRCSSQLHSVHLL